MFHGGTNPEIDNLFYSEFTVPKKSYDFQAPIGECGQIRDSYRRLKYIFYFLKGFEELLVPMKTCLPKGASEVLAYDVETLRWAVRATSDHGFVFINNYQDHVETQDILNNAVELELETESIRIPHESSFDMKSGECAILPFNLDMEGALLKSSTAQLITYIKDDDATVYFFFESDGMKAEYCFDRKTVHSVSGSFKENMLVFHPESGCDKLHMELESKAYKIKIVTLTHEEAMNFWECDVWGRERIILSSSDVLVNDESVKFRSTDNLIDFMVYPDPKLNTQNQKDCGIFRMYETKLPEKKLEMTVSYTEDSRADIDFDQNILDGVDEIIMRVDYIGDTGNAFIDGKLISDDFCYEGYWEIGLRKFADEIIEHGMYIYISPII